MLFDYPRSAAFGRVLPKNKIYEHAKPANAVKELFVRQVEQIVWSYKLAPQTVNLPSTQSVPEIQIFLITLKEKDLNHGLLRCIDEAIPFPIIYELLFTRRLKVIAAYKRPAESSSEKWVRSEYFETPWIAASEQRTPLPVVLNLEALYGMFLDPLLPCAPRAGETLKARIDRAELIVAKRRELQRCELRLQQERQFNRKVEVNAELRALKDRIAELGGR